MTKTANYKFRLADLNLQQTAMLIDLIADDIVFLNHVSNKKINGNAFVDLINREYEAVLNVNDYFAPGAIVTGKHNIISY
jgi:ABC-type iron transport system FetAB ATPase subunit